MVDNNLNDYNWRARLGGYAHNVGRLCQFSNLLVKPPEYIAEKGNMKRGVIKRPSSPEDRRRERAVRKLRELKEEQDNRKRKYEAKLKMQLQRIYEEILLDPDKFTPEQKDFADRLAVEHEIEIPIHYDSYFNFGHIFSDDEAEVILPIFKKYLTVEEQTTETIRLLLNCQYTGLTVKNERHLAMFFFMMYKRGIICKQWKSVIEENKLFLSRNLKPLTAKILDKQHDEITKRVKNCEYSSSNANLNLMEMMKEMETVIEEIKKDAE